MKTLKNLHKQTSLDIKIGLPVVIFMILPLTYILMYTVFTNRNIIF